MAIGIHIVIKGGILLKLIETVINHKVNNITGDELLKIGKQFNISITKQQADEIAKYLRGKNINIFDHQDRSKVIKEIAKITNPKTAKKVNELFLLFMN